ncbi:hypothetical protein HYW94_04075 [Candidatus Uhrbacteria bacterium]|nr:hypothetical protein [Candidatus Uhrbacteria bacterium]
MKIACLGSSKEGEGPIYTLMEEVGRLLAEGGDEVVVGDEGGIGMQVCRGAFEAGGSALGYPMMGKNGNTFLTKRVDCQRLSFGRGMPFFADFGIQLSGLMDADAFIIAATGGMEVLIQFMTAVHLNEEFWIPRERGKYIAILKPEELWDDPLWTEAMLDQLEEFGFLSETMNAFVCVVQTPRMAVDWARKGMFRPTPSQMEWE